MSCLRKTRDAVEELLRHEAAIVQAFHTFADEVSDPDLRETLESLCEERHEQVSRLRQVLFSLRRPEDSDASSSNAWRAFGNAGAGISTALGSRARMSVLRYDVERAVAAYDAVLDRDEVFAEVKDAIRKDLHPRALEHATQLRQYLQSTWGPRAVPSAPSWSDRSGGSWDRRLALAGLTRH